MIHVRVDECIWSPTRPNDPVARRKQRRVHRKNFNAYVHSTVRILPLLPAPDDPFRPDSALFPRKDLSKVGHIIVVQLLQFPRHLQAAGIFERVEGFPKKGSPSTADEILWEETPRQARSFRVLPLHLSKTLMMETHGPSLSSARWCSPLP